MKGSSVTSGTEGRTGELAVRACSSHHKYRALVCGAAVLALSLPLAAYAQTPVGPRAIVAGGWIDADGAIQTAGLVVIENGQITQVGGELPAGVPVDAYPAAVISPGLVDCQTTLGVLGGLAELNDAVQPKITASEAFNRYSPQMRAALVAGVTTFALAPDDQNVIGGRIAVCQTGGPDGAPRLLSALGPVKLSLSPDALKIDREPTSRGGAVGLLRDTLSAASERPNDADPIASFATGKLTGVLAAPSGADVLAALGLAEQFKLKLVLIHTWDAHRVAEQLAPHIAGVIVDPLDFTSSPRAAAAAGLYERRAVPVAIGGGLPDGPADALRIGAAVATRAGLTPSAARQAITSVPAEMLGVADRVGVVQVNHQADLVVFSGDPLDLRSRVLAVYVAGQRINLADEPTEIPAGANCTRGDQR